MNNQAALFDYIDSSTLELYLRGKVDYDRTAGILYKGILRNRFNICAMNREASEDEILKEIKKFRVECGEPSALLYKDESSFIEQCYKLAAMHYNTVRCLYRAGELPRCISVMVHGDINKIEPCFLSGLVKGYVPRGRLIFFCLKSHGKLKDELRKSVPNKLSKFDVSEYRETFKIS